VCQRLPRTNAGQITDVAQEYHAFALHLITAGAIKTKLFFSSSRLELANKTSAIPVGGSLASYNEDSSHEG
jgi:hypothetical protein